MSEIQTENEQVDAVEDNNRIYNGIAGLVTKTRRGTYDLFTKNVGTKALGGLIGLAAVPVASPILAAGIGMTALPIVKNLGVRAYKGVVDTYSLGA